MCRGCLGCRDLTHAMERWATCTHNHNRLAGEGRAEKLHGRTGAVWEKPMSSDDQETRHRDLAAPDSSRAKVGECNGGRGTLKPPYPGRRPWISGTIDRTCSPPGALAPPPGADDLGADGPSGRYPCPRAALGAHGRFQTLLRSGPLQTSQLPPTASVAVPTAVGGPAMLSAELA